MHALELRVLQAGDLPALEEWFRDPETRHYLGGPDWPARMMHHGHTAVGQVFRGAVQTGAYQYLALAEGRPVGYIDCGTFDRCTVCSGMGPDGPIITDSIPEPTGAIAFVVDPRRRGRGVGRAMIGALMSRPELAFVRLFEAGVDAANTASRRCLTAAGFRPASVKPDFEDMLYYRRLRRLSPATPEPRMGGHGAADQPGHAGGR
jgi:RimJ/RimL family protein N-acetyltransferase